MDCDSCSSQQDQGTQGYTFICNVGDDFYRVLQLIDSVTAIPIDISTWNFFCSIYSSYQAKINGDEPLIQISNSQGFTLVDPANGFLGIFIPRVETSEIPIVAIPGNSEIPQNSCVYDIVAVDTLSFQRAELRGNFIFQERLSIV